MRRLLLALALLGCAAPKPGDPPRVEFGRHECARCGMIVSEERYAAGYVGPDGETVAYDDLGELLKEPPQAQALAWARDFNGGGWLRLSEATLIQVKGLGTPMGTGWIAFRSKAEAEAFSR